ncbi:hypothetical protein DFS33DRAFT_1387390 [Desarmillaria ectypa]|nr:hypothetical protein DFS33DRAFT_1387390 [Desarmillaria ectypa]
MLVNLQIRICTRSIVDAAAGRIEIVRTASSSTSSLASLVSLTLSRQYPLQNNNDRPPVSPRGPSTAAKIDMTPMRGRSKEGIGTPPKLALDIDQHNDRQPSINMNGDSYPAIFLSAAISRMDPGGTNSSSFQFKVASNASQIFAWCTPLDLVILRSVCRNIKTILDQHGHRCRIRARNNLLRLPAVPSFPSSKFSEQPLSTISSTLDAISALSVNVLSHQFEISGPTRAAVVPSKMHSPT